MHVGGSPFEMAHNSMRVPKKNHENPKPNEVTWQRSERDATTRQSRERQTQGTKKRHDPRPADPYARSGRMKDEPIR
jgi:hypothetical protein